MADRVIWCERGWQPLYYGFCPSEAAWKREPSLEFEAYAMQAIAQNLIVAYEQTRGRLTRV